MHPAGYCDGEAERRWRKNKRQAYPPVAFMFEPGRAGRFGVAMDGLKSNILILGKSGVLGESVGLMMIDAHAEIDRLESALRALLAAKWCTSEYEQACRVAAALLKP